MKRRDGRRKRRVVMRMELISLGNTREHPSNRSGGAHVPRRSPRCSVRLVESVGDEHVRGGGTFLRAVPVPRDDMDGVREDERPGFVQGTSEHVVEVPQGLQDREHLVPGRLPFLSCHQAIIIIFRFVRTTSPSPTEARLDVQRASPLGPRRARARERGGDETRPVVVVHRRRVRPRAAPRGVGIRAFRPGRENGGTPARRSVGSL